MQLFIDTYGTFLHVKDGMFEVKIFHKEKEIKRKIAPGKISSIMLSKGTSLSYEAVYLALMHNIDILFLEFEGTPVGRVWHSKLGSTTKIRKHQLIASINEVGVKYVKEWITQKIENQLEFLKRLKKHRASQAEYFNEIITKLTTSKNGIENLKAKTISQIADNIRGHEGTAGRLYFEILGKILSKEYQFNGRSSRPATTLLMHF